MSTSGFDPATATSWTRSPLSAGRARVRGRRLASSTSSNAARPQQDRVRRRRRRRSVGRRSADRAPRRGDQCADDLRPVRGWSPRTMTTARGAGSSAAAAASPPGASSTGGAGRGFRTRCSSSQSIAVLDLVGVVAQDDDDVARCPAVAERVEDVLEERPTVERGERLRRAEAARGAGGEDDGGDAHRRPAPAAASRTRRARASGGRSPPYRSATTSAMIASAVSAGSRPPRSSPIGPRSRRQLVVARRRPRAGARAGRPASSSSPPRRRSGSRGASASTIAGSSNFTSWVRTATASSGPRPISSATSSGQPTMSRSTSRERASGRERRAAVDDDRLVAQLAGEADERAGDLDGADDDEPRPHRERLDEH